MTKAIITLVPFNPGGQIWQGCVGVGPSTYSGSAPATSYIWEFSINFNHDDKKNEFNPQEFHRIVVSRVDLDHMSTQAIEGQSDKWKDYP